MAQDVLVVLVVGGLACCSVGADTVLGFTLTPVVAGTSMVVHVVVLYLHLRIVSLVCCRVCSASNDLATSLCL